MCLMGLHIEVSEVGLMPFLHFRLPLLLAERLKTYTSIINLVSRHSIGH